MQSSPGNPAASRTARLVRLAPVLYLVSLLLVLSLVPEVLVVGDGRPNFDQIRYRFGLAGIVLSSLALPLLGMALATILAGALGHRRVLILLAAVSAIATIVVVGGCAALLLDSIQLRAVVPPPVRGKFTIEVAKAVAAGMAASLVLVALSVTAGKAAGRIQPPARRKSEEGSPLITVK